MPAATLKKIGKRVLQIGLPVVILALFLYQISQNWRELTARTFQWNPWLLALAFGGFVLQEISFGLIWQAVLLRLGHRLPLRVCLRIYLASEFVRYIPGNVWHVLTRILWVGKYGVSRPVAFASMTIELITKLAAAVLVFAASLLFWQDIGAFGTLLRGRGPLLGALGIGTILGLLVILHPRVLNGLLNLALRVLKRTPVQLTVRYSDILLVTLAWCLSWLVAGCAFYVLLLALWPATPLLALPVCIGICALAWDIGFVTFITPSGLGFREGAVVALFALALPLPGGLGVVMALLWRFVSTLAELLCVSVAYVSGGKQVRQIQQEQASAAPIPEKPTQQTRLDEQSAGSEKNEESTESIPVEGGITGE